MKKCQKCKEKKTCNFWSSDDWDRMEDWVCKLMNDKKIQGSVEWHEESKINTPEWCPKWGKQIKIENREHKLKRILKNKENGI